MNALKHMEVLFAAALVAGCVFAAMPEGAATAAPRATPRHAGMPVVVVKARRMTALEKRQSDDTRSAKGS